MPYNNTCFNITSKATPDPYLCYANDKFYLTFTANDKIPLWDAPCLYDFWDKPHHAPVWTPPTSSSDHIWAPKLLRLYGLWYIYYSSAHPKYGDLSHRIYVLRGPQEEVDPRSGPWESVGPIKGMDQRYFAVDGTVVTLEGNLYLVYSSLPQDLAFEDVTEVEQQLRILRLDDPTTAASSPSVMISRPEHSFEFTDEVGVNEGPQYLESPDGRWRGLVYTCGGSNSPTSDIDKKLNSLQFAGGDPLNPKSWKKSSKPLLQSPVHGPFGPAHGCFLTVGDETLALFHAIDGVGEGASGKKCRMQRVLWTDDGPFMGEVIGPTTRDVEIFLRSEGTLASSTAGVHGGTVNGQAGPKDVSLALVGKSATKSKASFLSLL